MKFHPYDRRHGCEAIPAAERAMMEHNLKIAALCGNMLAGRDPFFGLIEPVAEPEVIAKRDGAR